MFVNERVREEEPCTNYRLWLQFTALVNEMLRRKHHFMAQHSIILSSRETFLNALETFVKTHIQLPLNLRDYKRDRAMLQKYVNNKFEFGQTPRRAKEDLETIEMLRARPVIDEDENFIQISQMLIGKTRMETIPLSASAFAYFFYKSEMEMIMELALQKCTDKITYWDKKIETWIAKRTRYFSGRPSLILIITSYFQFLRKIQKVQRNIIRRHLASYKLKQSKCTVTKPATRL